MIAGAPTRPQLERFQFRVQRGERPLEREERFGGFAHLPVVAHAFQTQSGFHGLARPEICHRTLQRVGRNLQLLGVRRRNRSPDRDERSRVIFQKNMSDLSE